MIPRIHKSGTSFKFAVEYVTHDPDQSQSSERVAWTHTLNCAHDHIPSAVHEMYLTHRDAEFLKEQSGAGAGGGAVQKPVKHFTLSWHPDETPTREEMIEATQSYLKHMKWDEHQCVLAAHTDKDHVHVHGILNAIHPETGLKLDDSFERRRSQEWALEYERAHGQIYCEQRIQPVEERESEVPRNVLEQIKAHEAQQLEVETALRAKAAEQAKLEVSDPNNQEWKILKDCHREERLAFIAGGKQLYGDACKDAYREVREVFRPQWAEWHAARRDGLDFETLAAARAAILEEQKALLEERQKAACDTLRHQRDAEYADLLTLQKDERGLLRSHQADGISSSELLDLVRERSAGGPQAGERDDRFDPWRSPAEEVTARDFNLDQGDERSAPVPRDDRPVEEPEPARARPLGFLSGFIGLAGSFLSIIDPTPMGRSERKPPSEPPEFPPEQFKRVAEEAREEAERQAKEEYDRAWWEERNRPRERS